MSPESRFPLIIGRIGLALLVAGSMLGAQPAFSQGIGLQVLPPGTAPATRELYLEVFINGTTTGLVGNFRQQTNGSLSATAQELTEVGLKPPAGKTGNAEISLDGLPQVRYELKEDSQRLDITTVDEARSANVVDVGAEADSKEVKARADYGAVLNYSLYASSNTLFAGETELFEGVSGGFDARAFGPFGTVSQSFIAGYDARDEAKFIRLNSTWSYSDPKRLLTYKAGDFVSGGLSWTRPVFLGGLQVSRNFSLRSDLVTLPLPSFSGTAAVPSTLEVFAQNAQTYAGNVASGPFQVVNLPVVTGSGEARVVLRDALGRETVTTLPYYNSSRMLRRGLFDFSIEAGFPRRNYGIVSDDYDERVFGIASARYGLTDRLTVEGHLEGGQDLVNGGIGLVFPLGGYGAATIAGAGSYADGKSGGLVDATVEMSYSDWTVFGRIQRAFGDYQDIASITAEPVEIGLPGIPIYSTGVPRAIDQVSLGVPMPLDFSSLNLSYTRLEDSNGRKSSLVGMSYSQQVFKRSTFYASAFTDLENDDTFGVFAGLSIPFDNGISTSVGVDYGPDGATAITDIVKSEKRQNGSMGWRIRDAEGANTNRTAAVSYRSPWARFEAGIQQYERDVRATAQVDGAIAVAGGGVFATNRIDDSFAVVDVGAADVDVAFQNRAVGKTNKRGKIIVTDLNSYEPNSISIDPSNLPVDAEIPSTAATVVPADRSGVVVRFGVSDATSSAIVSFVDAGGTPLMAGLSGKVEGTGQSFVVGYDGEAYLQDLKSGNSVSIALEDGSSCKARFAYRGRKGEQETIKGVACQ